MNFGLSSLIFILCFVLISAEVKNLNSTTPDPKNNHITQKLGKDSLKVIANDSGFCPQMYRRVFNESIPRDGFKSGKIDEFKIANDVSFETYLWSCVETCCEKARDKLCNVVLVFKKKCYHIQCVTNEACLPKTRKADLSSDVQMVLVSPVITTEAGTGASWQDILKEKSSAEILPYEYANTEPTGANKFWSDSRLSNEALNGQERYFNPENIGNDIDDKLVKSSPYTEQYSSEEPYQSCDLANTCPQNERCELVSRTSLTGVCRCNPGFTRNEQNACTEEIVEYSSYLPRQKLISTEDLPAATTTAKAEVSKNLVVSVMSKEVRLPEKEVSLEAFTVPDEQTSKTTYKYFWTLVAQPKGPMNGTISDQSKSKVKLSNLSEGLYTFKVSVTGDNGTYGEALTNVTVLPQKRINRLPQVIITPKEQTIRQPTTNAVLDGSSSTDDDKIIGWQWEIVSGPLGYQPQLPEVNTLQLKDLTAPGNYTFKLTVTDSNNATNSSTASITVLKGTDYAPVANAGDAIILYLPNNNVTLNGNASSDDHEIVAWEWTKDASDEAKAVDMQNTRTPYLKLSNLEEGMYTFVLKVTDGSQQSSTAKVHVFVKPPSNLPPTANAGPNITTSLPRNWVLLNGTESKDDIGIKSYRWQQISGPNIAETVHKNATIANATSLTLGLYQFKLTVADENNNTASSVTWVKIVQERNAAPIANAGGDFSVTLPTAAIYLNGTRSSDDLRVAKYSWSRQDNSLAAGVIISNTDKQPVMILTDLAPGRYVFKLTVSDDQGLTGSDTVTITVHPDPMLEYLVQMTLPIDISKITQSEINSIIQKISLLVGDNMIVHVREVKSNLQTSAAVLIFYVERQNAVGSGTKPVEGYIVESLLKVKQQRDTFILGKLFIDVRTAICQNNCSGHGKCDVATRTCICDAFWMPTLNYFIGSDEANCDWSILYVFVSLILLCMLLSGLFWAIACSCRRTKKTRTRPKKQKYSLIGTRDEELGNYTRNNSLTDSDTDSDVLFETRTKPNGILRVNGKPRNRSGSSCNTRNKHQGPKTNRKIKA